MTSIIKYRIYCITDNIYRNWLLPNTDNEPVSCPDNSSHTIDTEQTVITETVDLSGGSENISTGNGTVSGISSSNSLSKDVFSHLITTQYTPIVHNSFIGNNINPQAYEVSTYNGGTVALNNMYATCTLSETVGSRVFIRAKKVLKYFSGYSSAISGAVKFSTGITGSNQLFGIFNNTDSVAIGYSGENFVIRHTYHGQVHISCTEITTAASNNSEIGTLTLNGIVYNIPLKTANGDTNYTAYQISNFFENNKSWDVRHVGNKICFVAYISEQRNGTYSFSSTHNAEMTITTISTGTTSTIVEINKNDWNGSSILVNTIDPTNFNMYQIEYTWYGVGNIQISCYNTFSSRYEPIHTFNFANQTSNTSVDNPNMYIGYLCESLQSSTVLSTTFAGSFGCVLGEISRGILPQYSIICNKNIASKKEYNLVSLKIRNSIKDLDINSAVNILRISITNNSSRLAIIRVYTDCIIGTGNLDDYPIYQFQDEQYGVLLYDKHSLTHTGGILLKTLLAVPNANTESVFHSREFFVQKDTLLLFTGEIISGSSDEIYLTVDYEDFL